MLHEQQGLPGWCVLWLKDHREHLSDLSPAVQAAIFGEVARVAGAIRAVVKPRRINYECLGNVTAHVHWHVIPRYQTDPEPRAPIWGWPKPQLDGNMPPEVRIKLAANLRAALHENADITEFPL